MEECCSHLRRSLVEVDRPQPVDGAEFAVKIILTCVEYLGTSRLHSYSGFFAVDRLLVHDLDSIVVNVNELAINYHNLLLKALLCCFSRTCRICVF